MFKTLIPIVGILVAVGIFFTYVEPTFREIQTIQAEADEYAEAAEHAVALQRRIAELKTERDAIRLSDLERLEALVPDRIDEVAFLVDLDALADEHNLSIRDVQVGGDAPVNSRASRATRDDSDDEEEEIALSPEEGGVEAGVRNQYSTLDIFFSVNGSYESLRALLADCEESLTLLDIIKIEFIRPQEGPDLYSLGVRLYGLNMPTE